MPASNAKWKAIEAGVIAPNLTPFNDDLSVARDLYLSNAKRLFADGCSALAPFGTTGEALSVSVSERLSLIAHLIDGGINPAKLVPGTGLTNLPETADLTRECLDMGCAAAMILPPFYFKGVSDEGLYAYYGKLIEMVGRDDLAIYLYHIPQVSGVPLSIDFVVRLKHNFPDQIVGIKDSSGVWENTRALFDIDGLIVYPGSELPLIDALDLGGIGCISATANINTNAIANIVSLHKAGHRTEAQAAFEAVKKVRLAVQDYAPIPAQKRLLAFATGDARWANVRPPLEELEESKGRELLERLGREASFQFETQPA